MSYWTEHIMLDGPLAILPDLPLVAGVMLNRGKHLGRRNGWMHTHRFIHTLFFATSCFIVGLSFRSRVLTIIGRHIILDLLTHKKIG